MTAPQRSGLPDPSDVVGQYRLHADCISNGERIRPARALLVEIDASGQPRVYSFGRDEESARERIASLTEALHTLACAINAANADASH